MSPPSRARSVPLGAHCISISCYQPGSASSGASCQNSRRCLALFPAGPCCPPWRQSTAGSGELVCVSPWTGRDRIPAVPPGVSIQMRNGLITPVLSGLFQEPLKPKPCLPLPTGMCRCLPGVRTLLRSNLGRKKGFS